MNFPKHCAFSDAAAQFPSDLSRGGPRNHRTFTYSIRSSVQAMVHIGAIPPALAQPIHVGPPINA